MTPHSKVTKRKTTQLSKNQILFSKTVILHVTVKWRKASKHQAMLTP